MAQGGCSASPNELRTDVFLVNTIFKILTRAKSRLLRYIGPEQPPSTPFQPPLRASVPAPAMLHQGWSPVPLQPCLATDLNATCCPVWTEIRKGEGKEGRLVVASEICECLQCPNNVRFVTYES